MKTVIRNSYSPVVGDYCEKIVIDEETNKKYIFDCDGVWTLLDGSVDEEEILRKAAEYTDQEVGQEASERSAADDELAGDIADETLNRENADREIWQEIEAIEASSDVVDIVGTKAELDAYDTSTLKDNDIVKVLQDETRNDAITYYRWNGTAFIYVGAEGPYYTASETDALLADKQDNLTAGSGINISSNDVISFDDSVLTHGGIRLETGTDTYTFTENTSNRIVTIPIPGYSDFTGATSSAAGTDGLVPAPTAGDQDKFLSGDGTWKTVSGGATYTAGQNIQISNQNVISATDTTYGVFSTTDNGLVPACNVQDPSYAYLAGDGSWNELQVYGEIMFYLPNGDQYLWQEGTNDRKYFDFGGVGMPTTFTLTTLTPGSYPNGVIEMGSGRRVYSVDMDDLDRRSIVLEFPTGSARTFYCVLSSFSSSLTGHLSFIIQGVENGSLVTYLLDIADDSGRADVITKLSSSAYTLPPATTSTLGGVMVGSNLSIDANGVLSATIPATNNINTTDWNALWQ